MTWDTEAGVLHTGPAEHGSLAGLPAPWEGRADRQQALGRTSPFPQHGTRQLWPVSSITQGASVVVTILVVWATPILLPKQEMWGPVAPSPRITQQA